MVEAKNFRAPAKGARSRKMFYSSNFCESKILKIKGNAARVPIIPVCTWGYRTSKLFVAPCEVDEKPYKSWRFGAASTLEYALLRRKNRRDDVDFVHVGEWFRVARRATTLASRPRRCHQAGALAPPHRDADVTHEVSRLPHKSPFVLATHAELFSMHERPAREMSMPVQTRDRTLNTPRIIRNDLH